MIETYRLHQTANDGAAVLMAMFPALIADQEFEDSFLLYFDQRKAGYTDLTKAVEYIAILCDNAYACTLRITNSTVSYRKKQALKQLTVLLKGKTDV